MLRALWFLTQAVLVILTAIWLIERPGDVTLEAFGYTLTVQTGFFLILFILTLMVCVMVVRLVGAIVALPSWMGLWGRKRRKARALRQMTQGYALLAAGQPDKALKLSLKARDILPEVRAILLLLEAQSHRALGQQAAAASAYRQLMKDKDGAFLGLKGLLGQSMAAGQDQRALEYAQQAVKMHPKSGQMVRILYGLQIAVRDFDSARATLKKAVKLGAVDKEAAAQDDIAMLYYQAEKAEEDGRLDDSIHLMERAVKIDPVFVPGVVLLSRYYMTKGKNRRAQSLIETAWKTHPHPALAELWGKLAPPNSSRDMMKRMRWYESLVAIRPDSALGQMAAARAAMEDNLIGEARAYLTRAEKIEPSAALYRLFLKLEHAAGADEDTITALEEKMVEAPASPVWTCRRTGMVYENWSPIARPHGSFNTIEWGLPRITSASALQQEGAMGDLLMVGAL